MAVPRGHQSRRVILAPMILTGNEWLTYRPIVDLGDVQHTSGNQLAPRYRSRGPGPWNPDSAEWREMPLDGQYPDCVVFIATERERGDGTKEVIAIGTAFLIEMPFGDGTDRTFTYAVTAGHVVSRPSQYYLQVNTANGVRDVLISGWVRHPVQDVAVANVFLGDDWKYALIHTDMFVGDDVQPVPRLGDRVYFIGLLSFLRGTRDEITPMVISGNIGRFNQKDIPIEWDNTQSKITAHLVDCRSYGGFSGSPCFIQAQVSEYRDFSKQIPGGMAGNVLFDRTLLFGLMSGHFDQKEVADVSGDPSLEVRMRINSGVGLVTPAKFISEILQMDEFVTARRDTLAEIKRLETAGDGRVAAEELPSGD